MPNSSKSAKGQTSDSATIEKASQSTFDVKRENFIDYVRHVWPWFIIEEVHLIIAEALEAVAYEELDRVMIFMAPRAGKSSLASLLFPSWYLGNYPGDHLMAISYAKELTFEWGWQIRELVMSEEYQEVFPKTEVLRDRRSAHNWQTSFGGKYYAGSVTGAIAGRGFHLGIIDDPLSEQDAWSETAAEFAWRWYGPGFYTRRDLQRNAIVIMSTRWRVDDLPGRLIDAEGYDDLADKFHIVDVPAILDKSRATVLNKWRGNPMIGTAVKPGPDIEHKAGGSFAPRRVALKELLRTKAQPSMSAHMWNALYMQNPTLEEGAILKRSKWREWPYKDPPAVEYLLQVYDTAFEEGEENDYSARTTWGIFVHQEKDREPQYHCILLEAWHDKVEFPELRKLAKTSYDDYEPDRVLIEKKASGHSLIQEMRRKKVPVLAFVAEKYLGGRRTKRSPKSKQGRAHVASVVLDDGCVWYMPKAWAELVIGECANFPFGGFDDFVDTCVMAWLFLRKTFWLELSDEGHRAPPPPTSEKRRYYG